MTKQDDGLFLLEVLIDKIVFVKSPCFSDKDFRTCVNIECPAVEPLEICDDDPGVCIAKSGGPFVKTFNNGKSCLFSLKEADIGKAMSKFPIKISVYKSLPCGCLPTKIIMGEATIDMTKEFVQARKKFLEDPTAVSYQALKDSFRIVGPDGAETGEIVMFLRISCFGKLIITRFQGAGSPPNLGAGGTSAIVDRSCDPKKDYQTTQDPCACGAARGAGAGTGAANSGAAGPPCMASGGGGGHGGVCPIARDPYNSQPCEDPDDPCYCSGPKPAIKPQMACRNTDQYCLHVPKGTLPRLPFCQELSEARKLDLKSTNEGIKAFVGDGLKQNVPNSKILIEKDSQATIIAKECLKIFIDNLKLPVKSCRVESTCSSSSVFTLRSRRRSVSFSDSVNYARRQRSPHSCSGESVINSMFNKNETTVFMTLFDEFCPIRTSGTQATASINKCLQVSCDYRYSERIPAKYTKSDFYSSTTMSTLSQRDGKRHGVLRNSDIYFFGRKKTESKSGMGGSDSKTKLRRTGQVTAAPVKSEKGKPANVRGNATVQARSQSNTAAAQTRNARGSSASTSTGKVVSIIDNKQACPAVGVKGDMVATVSHIRIGPSQPCPVHGREPCQGPKCILASSGEEQQAPVKVTTVTNPRRGVFELVIRRMTGAPLATNELMLEWTPPPLRPSTPCGSPCLVACSPPGPCRPPKCKMIVCRSSPCKPKYCRKPCKKPCGPMPCRSIPCKRSYKSSCCGKPCRPCKPCPPPPKCRPCPPSSCAASCALPCCKDPCGIPCKSSPCLRPCPVGRNKARRARSQPRMKTHKKRISPCYNRSKTCPVVRCRSVPGPCLGCCVSPPCCRPRKCCSIFPYKPPKRCKSACSTCCG